MTARKPTKALKKPAKKTTRPAASSRRSKPAAGRKSVSKARSKSSQPRRLPAIRLPGSPLSLDRKLDILGIGLALVGLLTLLSLLSSSHGPLIGMWIALLGVVFGWGMYLLPLGLIALGVWLVLRHFDRLPQLAPERMVGLILTYLALLTAFHFLTFPVDRAQNFSLASEGQGGGYIGAAILAVLQVTLGWAGAGIALAAWALIALAMTFDVTITELFGGLSAPIGRLLGIWRQWLDGWAAKRRSAALRRTPAGPTSPAGALGGQPPQVGPAFTAAVSRAGLPQAGQVEWVLPPLSEILEQGLDVFRDDEIDLHRARVIEETLASFGAPARVIEINRGPTITQFGVEPGFVESRGGQMRVRVSRIASLADDLALALSARRIRIQAPVPSKGYVGIEVPNDEISLVALRDLIESEAFQRLKSPLRFALGQDVAGNPVSADLAAMPHLLIAGATGSGKSVCVNALICCLLLNNTPDDLRIIMVDPKRVELAGYNGVPHLLAPVVVELDRVIGALQWVAREMDQRYHRLAQAGARNIVDYNERLAAGGEKKLPNLVVIIDELADLMMLAPDETERTITRLAQLARATGIHLVIATQRPSVDVVTGLIKANFPARVAFAVASGVDSRVILDQPGADRLLGRGDMLFQAPDAAAPVRLQGAFVSDPEIQRLVAYWREFSGGQAAYQASGGAPLGALPSGLPLKQMPMWEEMQPEEQVDSLYPEAVDLVRRQGRASISMLQRRLRIGYSRAARLIETMQEKGVVGPSQPGAQGLEVLDYGPAAPPVEERGD